jgi:nucleotide-binding universal stress UspA family protein
MNTTKKKNIILVPVDFSEASGIAVECAVELAKVFGSEIIMLNIFENVPVDEASRKQLQSQFIYRDILKTLEKDAERITQSQKVKTGFLIKEGTIFDHIGKAAEEVGANLMVMGTHGIKGVQHITGSYAARVIHNTPVPVIVVQKKSNYQPIKNITVYLDLTKDSEALENWASHYSKVFKANVHLVVSEEMREMVKMNTEHSLIKMEKIFKEHNINYTVKSFSSERGEFIKNLLQHAAETRSDLIMIEQKLDIDKYIIGKDEQDIMFNSHQIPVFIVNPSTNPSVTWA